MKLLPLKLRTYETVHHLNRAFELVRMNLERLDKLGFDRRYMREYRVMSEELRADVNHRLIETLQDREEKDWAHFGRLARRRERRLRDPNDVLIEAKRLRAKQQQQKKQSRKPQQKQKATTPRKQVRA
jgi:hypothetical protein